MASRRSPTLPGKAGARDWLLLPVFSLALWVAGCSRPAASPPTSDPAVEAVDRGVTLMGQYEYARAVAAFEQALALTPGHPEVKVNLAIALFNRGQKEAADVEQAVRLLEDVLAQDPSHRRALYFRGITLQHLGDAEASLPFLEKVVQLEPDDGAAWYLLGVSRQRVGQPAEPDLLKAIALKPYLSSAYYKLSQIAMLAGDTAQAGRYLDTFKRLRESPLNELIEVPQYGAMGDLALVMPLPSLPTENAVAPAYALGPGRVLFETDETLFGAPAPGAPLGGAALGDLNRDGNPDLVMATASQASGGRLIALLSGAAGSWREAAAALQLGEVRHARACAIGDFDNDEVNDLLVAAGASNRLFRGVSNAPFVEVSGAFGHAPAGGESTTAFCLDADHDGDLDVFTCSAGAGQGWIRLLNNQADGTFRDLAATNGLASAGTDTAFALPGDLDGDRDVDLVLLERGGTARVFLNNLLGAYSERNGGTSKIQGERGGVLQDFDGNGTLDLLALGGQPATLHLHLGDGRGGFGPGLDLTGIVGGGAERQPLAALRVADLNLDGALDVVVFGRDGRFLLNNGRGEFVPGASGWKVPAGIELAGVEVADLTGDHVPDLICLEQGAQSRVVLYPGELSPPGTALAIRATGVRSRDKRTRSPASGYGVRLTVRAGGQEQRLQYTGLNGGANQSLLPAVFGLRGYAAADYVQFNWPDGVAQVEGSLAAGALHVVAEVERKISSCPVLFAWNGERFEFITDFAGVGGLGYFVAPGVSAPPQVLEHIKIEPHQLRPRDGYYELRVTEPMEEAAYLDQLELWAVGHAETMAVYPDERLAVQGPAPTRDWLLTEAPLYPARAITPWGEDCLERVLQADRRYAYSPPLDRRFIGFCAPHTLELDFGRALATYAGSDRVFLFIHGFIEYPYSQTVYAAGQAAVAWEPIRVDADNGSGGWRTIVPDAGAPGGMGRMMTVELTDRLPDAASRLRLTTNLEIGYDQVFIGRVRPEPLDRQRVPLASATLRRLGFPREVSPDGRLPLIYDYAQIEPAAPFHVLRGAYTRYGAVEPLLAAFDDQYVIMGPGDEIALRFAANTLPPLGTGMARSFILVSHAYCKDMDLYTLEPQTLAPLPFHGMSRYPYPPTESGPNTSAHREYHARYNTRLR